MFAQIGYGAELPKLTKTAPTVGENEYLYTIKNNEVLVNDQLITLFAFSKGGISVSYRNKTAEKTKPEYTIDVYNAYGMLIGTDEVGASSISFGSSTYMEPGAVSSEKIYLDEYPLKKILENTGIKLPADLMTMRYIVISKTNTKKEASKPAEKANDTPSLFGWGIVLYLDALSDYLF